MRAAKAVKILSRQIDALLRRFVDSARLASGDLRAEPNRFACGDQRRRRRLSAGVPLAADSGPCSGAKRPACHSQINAHVGGWAANLACSAQDPIRSEPSARTRLAMCRARFNSRYGYPLAGNAHVRALVVVRLRRRGAMAHVGIAAPPLYTSLYILPHSSPISGVSRNVVIASSTYPRAS